MATLYTTQFTARSTSGIRHPQISSLLEMLPDSLNPRGLFHARFRQTRSCRIVTSGLTDQLALTVKLRARNDRPPFRTGFLNP
jgi:hypothetical protein